MFKIFHRLSKWFLDLWRKAFRKGGVNSRPSRHISASTNPPPMLQTFPSSVFSAKDYGEYLLQSGKWKRNKQRNRFLKS